MDILERLAGAEREMAALGIPLEDCVWNLSNDDWSEFLQALMPDNLYPDPKVTGRAIRGIPTEVGKVTVSHLKSPAKYARICFIPKLPEEAFSSS